MFTSLFLGCLTYLDHDDFFVREQANIIVNHLMKWNPKLYGPLLPSIQFLTVESDHRLIKARSVYNHFKAVSFKPSNVPVWPCIDVLQHNYKEHRESDGEPYKYLYSIYLVPVVRQSPFSEIDRQSPYYNDYREAARLFIVNMLEYGELNNNSANDLLDWMYENELQVIPGSDRERYNEMRKSLVWTDGFIRSTKMEIPKSK